MVIQASCVVFGSHMYVDFFLLVDRYDRHVSWQAAEVQWASNSYTSSGACMPWLPSPMHHAH